MKTKPAFLYTKNLSVGYGSGKHETLVLQGIDIQISPGELLCFLGANGVGKSTLLRTIAGIQPALCGSIMVEGKPLQQLSLTERAQMISLVLTDRTSGGNLSAYELVALGRHPYTNWSGRLQKKDHQKVEEAIAATHTEMLMDKKMHTLSDGQRQKVMITRALAQDSKLMILDEPTAHLDLSSRIEIMTLLLTLARQTQKAIVVATHELSLALQTADRLWLASFNGPLLTGIPEDLALNKSIEKAFLPDHSKYDMLTGRFKLPSHHEQSIQLNGPIPEKQWTQYALERVGFSLADEKGDITITIDKKEEETCWTMVSGNQNKVVVNSIEMLIEKLKSMNT